LNDAAAPNPFAGLFLGVMNPGRYEETQRTFSIRDLIKTTSVDLLTYRGSLTTPNCEETVTWMLSTKPLTISSAELAEFRQLRTEAGDQLLTNVRPLQELNERPITVYRVMD